MNTPNSKDSLESAANAIVALEEKFTFQQQQLEQLNAVITNQQSEISELHSEVKTLTNLVRVAIERGGYDLPHERPPHY